MPNVSGWNQRGRPRPEYGARSGPGYWTDGCGHDGRLGRGPKSRHRRSRGAVDTPVDDDPKGHRGDGPVRGSELAGVASGPRWQRLAIEIRRSTVPAFPSSGHLSAAVPRGRRGYARRKSWWVTARRSPVRGSAGAGTEGDEEAPRSAAPQVREDEAVRGVATQGQDPDHENRLRGWFRPTQVVGRLNVGRANSRDAGDPAPVQTALSGRAACERSASPSQWSSPTDGPPLAQGQPTRRRLAGIAV